MVPDAFDRLLIAELTAPVDRRITGLVDAILGPCQPLGVLFYGSGLRQFDPDGLFDFYVILEKLSDWHQSTAARIANEWLPPNVQFAEARIDGRILRAKVAIITLAQFQARACPDSIDTTIWARFTQPVRLVWVRNDAAADALLMAIRQSVITAAGWAARLADGAQSPDFWWTNLFAHTYEAELRVETKSRGSVIVAGQEKRFATMLACAWDAAGISFSDIEGLWSPRLSERQRTTARRAWRKKARRGQWLNVMRLIKAAFTFRDGARYLAWKIERHSGRSLPLSDFEARHPLLCLPWLLWRARHVFRRRR
ncbi:hypothetical protein AA101099_1959 [Neoasaia chiangmaiensis NBRC 101099]|uniref:Uncharacterized protein n=1 Tax=Neoasaia chiangmaiensis TaxID=320497 RepID=A0A1U9KT54_9PROT|nr:hypothetical protein [Neoasaia chiangmaiensis]AQS89026.1 hypothetical protein A0U93_15110 [Neoasaia chiangmaiensis]GBR40102.1 hypothetical protein AA101099_1959 [Neoasaia chiangmaiensis NBRC 101099]GEN14055.1 hypothetical protein NCH01_04860 [Neoasaia chiangmaiensis]